MKTTLLIILILIYVAPQIVLIIYNYVKPSTDGRNATKFDLIIGLTILLATGFANIPYPANWYAFWAGAVFVFGAAISGFALRHPRKTKN